MTSAPEASPTRRVTSRARSWRVVRTVLAWFVIALSLLVLFESLKARNPLGPPLAPPVISLAVPLILLRRRPLAVLTVLILGLVMVATLADGADAPWFLSDIRDFQALAADVAVGYVAATRPRRISITAGVVALLAQVLLLAGFPYHDLATTAAIMVIGTAGAWTIGHLVRQRRRYLAAQRDQAEVQAVQAERLRIARELHDMIAHSIGVIAIQAGVGRRVIDTQPTEARNALAAIEDTSRDTLAGLRRMLGTLRGTDAAPLDPTPGLGDLDALVARSTEAGLRVTVRRSGDATPLPADLDLSAYRIVQEALTNVIRHARARHCTVAIDRRDDELSLDISDDGTGSGTAGTGYGIVGMRERVALLHGTFSAGPQPGGGFRVAATLPLAAR
ncbi:MAG TPA: sensor histidine kinase [Actinocatenispora sp.]